VIRLFKQCNKHKVKSILLMICIISCELYVRCLFILTCLKYLKLCNGSSFDKRNWLLDVLVRISRFGLAETQARF